MKSLTDYTAIFSSGLDKYLNENELGPSDSMPTSPKTEQFMESVLKSEWHDQKEVVAKKILSTAATIAKSKGIAVPDSFISGRAVDIAITADEAIDTVKAAYKVAKGEISVSDWLEEKAKKVIARVEVVAHSTIDRVADVAKNVVNTKLDQLIDKGVDIVANAVSTVCPYAKVIAPAVKVVAKVVANPVKKFICSGIDKVAVGAKKVVNAVGNVARTVVSKAKDFVKKTKSC